MIASLLNLVTLVEMSDDGTVSLPWWSTLAPLVWIILGLGVVLFIVLPLVALVDRLFSK